MNKKAELVEKKEQLKKQMQEVDKELDRENIKNDLIKMSGFTDVLNSMFQNPALERHCPEECNELYEIMQKIDRLTEELTEEHGFTEDELC
jgi:conjugal transfer/entry exclusion protein